MFCASANVGLGKDHPNLLGFVGRRELDDDSGVPGEMAEILCELSAMKRCSMFRKSSFQFAPRRNSPGCSHASWLGSLLVARRFLAEARLWPASLIPFQNTCFGSAVERIAS
jgi:hypothetical protein